MSLTISILCLLACISYGEYIQLDALTQNGNITKELIRATEAFLSNHSLDIKYTFTEDEATIVELFLTDGMSQESANKILLDTRMTPSPYICVMAETLGYPYVVTSPNFVDKCQPVHMRLTISDYIEAAIQIFEYENDTLNDIVFLLEEQYELDSSTFHRKDKRVLNIMVHTLHDGNLTTNVQQSLTNSDSQMFMVIGSYSSIKDFFTKVENLTIYKHDHWIVAPLDDYHCPTPNLTYFSFVCLHHKSLPGDDLGLSSANSSMDLFWYIQFLKVLENAATNWNGVNDESNTRFAQFLQASTEELNRKEELSRLYLTKIEISDWKTDSQLIGNWTKDGSLYMDSRPFSHVPLVVMSVILIHEPPFIKRIHSGNRTTYEGYTIDVLNEIAKRMGFYYHLKEVPDDQYGVLLSDGTWTGVIGEIAKGAGDLGAGPISVTAERESVIDFTAPYYDYAGLQILIKNPAKKKSLFVFATVFTEYVWITWACVLFVTALALYGYHRLQFRAFDKTSHGSRIKNPFNLRDSLWFVMASITLAGPERSPITFSSRLLVAGFWFFCQIMMATYTANLAAFMTSSRLNTPIESLDDLASQSAIKYSALAGSVSETYFVRMANIEDNFYTLWKDMSYYSNSGTAMNDYAVWDYPLGDKYSKILSVINETGFIATSEQGYARVLEENFAFIQETPMLKYEMSRKCGLMTVGQPFSSKPYAFVLPENSPLVEEFSSTILQLQSETILTNLKEKWWKNGTLKCSDEADETSGLTLNTLGGIFIVTAAGCGFGFILLGLEFAISKFQKHRKRKQHLNNAVQIHQNGSSSRTCLTEDDFENGKDNHWEKSNETFYADVYY